MKITIPNEIKQKIYSKAPDSSNASTLEFATTFNVLKIILRKNIIYDYNGYLTKEFILYIKNGKALCPAISCRENEDKCDVNDVSMFNQDFFIAFDKNLPFNPYELYMNGELSIMYLLKQDSLVATTPSIKCDIIDAKNALTLHESDPHYFYKPSIITDAEIDYTHRVINHETSLYETITEKVDCYKMVYKLPPENEYEIPLNLNFKFIEHCFGNEWSLRWTIDDEHVNGYWTRDNVQGRSNGKIESSKQYFRVDKKYNDYGMSGCYVRCKHDEWNGRMLNVFSNDDNFMKVMFSSGKTYLLFKDGTIENAATNYRMDIDRYKNVDAYNKEGYDYLPLFLRINNNDKDAVNNLLNRVEKIYLDMIINGALNRLSFRWDELHQDQNFGFYIDLISELDSVEKVNNFFLYSCIDESTRNIELYLRKDFTDLIEEINWDSTTNAFDYIIKQQFYEIQPNPNAATTLYTDFNIASSKIITADNITTMRSDLNLVTNTVDVVSYDVKDIKSNVETLNSEMAEQMQKTKYLSKKVDEVDMKANIGIALGAAGIGVGSKALSFAFKGAGSDASAAGRQMTNTVSNVAEHASRGEMILEDISGGRGGNVLGDGSKFLPDLKVSSKPFSLTREVPRTDLTPILEWCKTEYTPFNDIPFEDELDDPSKQVVMFNCALDLCNRFRSSLKPTFNALATRINEITNEIESIDVNEQIVNVENNINNKFKEYISRYDLKRDDKIDVFAKIDNEHHILSLEFEDDVIKGLIVFKTFAVNNTASRQRRFYIKIVDGEITEYKGVNENLMIDDISIKGLARSEDDRVAYMPNAELIQDATEKLISIQFDSNYIITGAVVVQCTFTRQMNYKVSDLAYIQDVEALDKKINALAEVSHNNDVSMASIQETYTTVDEVNEALSNYVLKTEIPEPVDLNEYYTKIESDDKYALKTEITKNPLTVDENYSAFYDIDYEDSNLIDVFCMNYQNKQLNIYCEYKFKNLLFIFTDARNIKHFVRIDAKNSILLIDEIYGESKTITANNWNEDDYKFKIDNIEFEFNNLDEDGYVDFEKFYFLKEQVDLTNYALKTELNETANLLDTYARNHQHLAQLVGEQYVEIMELKNIIASLQNRLNALEKINDPDSEWKEYYVGFSEKANEDISSYFAYDYNPENKFLYLWITNNDGAEAPDGEYLLILHDKDMKKHFIRMITRSGAYTAYFDEVYLHENAPVSCDNFEDVELNIDYVNNQSYNEVYKKP